ncbi:MAG: hypothetical protein D6815_03715 [Candidatus Dadabacteria bacterium]|nr:MAG: hypothetical protein D6815_03715 [Candidatus Dadabacteria bacterium]
MAARSPQERIARAFTAILVLTGSSILSVGFALLINSPSAAFFGLVASLVAHWYGGRALRCPACGVSLYRTLVSAKRLLTSWRAWSIDEIAACPHCSADLRARPSPPGPLGKD